jgi:hypothetical protein
MRRCVSLCALAALCLPVLALAGSRSAEDGTLSVRGAEGKVRLLGPARGAVIGRCDSCRFILKDVLEGDGAPAVVNGEEASKDADDDGTLEWYQGTNVRFRLIGGRYVLRISGKGIDLSAVGTATVLIKGTDGTFALNGETPRTLPLEWKRFRLAAPATP